MISNEMHGLSVCIIVRNEEKSLEKCLASVQKCAGEIILTDTGSTDKTIQIAAGYKCRIINFPWSDDFSAARNAGLDIAVNPYILIIDADEILVNSEKLNEIIDSADASIGVWLVNVVSESPRPDGSMERTVSALPRLFRNVLGFRYEGIVHEQILPSILKSGYKVASSELIIYHEGYSANSGLYDEKIRRNLRLLDIAVENNPENSFTLYQRAKTLLAAKQYSGAERDIKQAINLAEKSAVTRAQYLNMGALIAWEARDLNHAKERLFESLEIIPSQPFAYFLLGDIFLAENNFYNALEAYNKIDLSMPETIAANAASAGLSVSPDALFFRMGRCRLGMKQYDEAEMYFRNGLNANKADIQCLAGLANVFFKRKDFIKSMFLLEKAKNLSPHDKDIDAFLDSVRKIAESDISALRTAENDSAPVKPLLSVSMIVKNEEKELSGCLETIKGVADEIIVVDTGSSDKTVEIAKYFGAKVFYFEWINDFSAARNESMKHCSGDWILYLDADERLNPENSWKIRPMLELAGEDIGGFIVTLESEHAQLDGSSEMHRGGYPRIFRNIGYPKIGFKGRVHEQITPSIFALNKSIDFSDVTITHLGYNRPRDEMEEKIKRNYKMLMEHIQEEPLNGYAWYQLGQTLAHMKLFAEAEKAVRFAIDSGKLSDSVYASAAATLSQLLGNQKHFEEALYWAEKSLSAAPEQVYGLNLKAYSLLYIGKYEEAEVTFLEVLRRLKKKKSVPLSGFDVEIPENIIYYGLNEARKKMESVPDKNSKSHNVL